MLIILQVVVWPENRKCDQKWLLENIKGAAGVLVMMTEPVWSSPVVLLNLFSSG